MGRGWLLDSQICGVVLRDGPRVAAQCRRGPLLLGWGCHSPRARAASAILSVLSGKSPGSALVGARELKRKIDWRATMGIIDSMVAWAGEHETFLVFLFMLPFAIGLSFLFGGGDGADYGGDQLLRRHPRRTRCAG